MTDLFTPTQLIQRKAISLRPYQTEAVEAVEREFQTDRKSTRLTPVTD